MFRPDEKFMAMAIDLAEQGRPWAHPNPLVGCVIVSRERVVAQGVHRRFGGLHAEAEALRRAGSRAKGGTVYVTLEPCPHWGKTPPCADALVRSQVRRVVVATRDPHPEREGRGISRLRQAGISVYTGVLGARAQVQNRAFFSRHRLGRPWVVLKMAQSLDGKTATASGRSQWITGGPARSLGHKLRGESDAVLVGAETLRRDNPSLTSRGLGPNPLRVVLSKRLHLPPRAKVWTDGVPVWVFTSTLAPVSRVRTVERWGGQVFVVPMDSRGLDLRKVLSVLAKRGVSQLMVEGGARTAAAFLRAHLVDEMYLFSSSSFLGGKARSLLEGDSWPLPGIRLQNTTVTSVGDDWLFHSMGAVKK